MGSGSAAIGFGVVANRPRARKGWHVGKARLSPPPGGEPLLECYLKTSRICSSAPSGQTVLQLAAPANVSTRGSALGA